MPVGVEGGAVLVVDLDVTDLWELLEVEREQVGDGVVDILAVARTAQVDARDAVLHFDLAVSGETILE